MHNHNIMFSLVSDVPLNFMHNGYLKICFGATSKASYLIMPISFRTLAPSRGLRPNSIDMKDGISYHMSKVLSHCYITDKLLHTSEVSQVDTYFSLYTRTCNLGTVFNIKLQIFDNLSNWLINRWSLAWKKKQIPTLILSLHVQNQQDACSRSAMHAHWAHSVH